MKKICFIVVLVSVLMLSVFTPTLAYAPSGLPPAGSSSFLVSTSEMADYFSGLYGGNPEFLKFIVLGIVIIAVIIVLIVVLVVRFNKGKKVQAKQLSYKGVTLDEIKKESAIVHTAPSPVQTPEPQQSFQPGEAAVQPTPSSDANASDIDADLGKPIEEEVLPVLPDQASDEPSALADVEIPAEYKEDVSRYTMHPQNTPPSPDELNAYEEKTRKFIPSGMDISQYTQPPASTGFAHEEISQPETTYINTYGNQSTDKKVGSRMQRYHNKKK
ncbi:MAG: hypothetical protein ACOYJB_05435 [Christensenellaceae bacterium]